MVIALGFFNCGDNPLPVSGLSDLAKQMENTPAHRGSDVLRFGHVGDPTVLLTNLTGVDVH